MVSSTTKVAVKLSKTKLATIKRAARRLRLTPSEYVKDLIEEGLAREKRIRETPLEILAAPVTQALQGMTDEELDAMVDAARHPESRRRRRA